MEKKTKARTRGRGLNSLRENFARWQSFASNLRLHLEQMPHATAQLEELEAVLARIQTALAARDVLLSQSGDLLRNRADDVAQARELRNRLNGQLIGHFGSNSEMLKQFGLRPKGSSKRRPSSPQEEPAPPEPEAKPEPA